MFMKFIEIYKKDHNKKEFSVRDLFINIDYVISVSPEENMKNILGQSALAKLISEDANYAKLLINLNKDIHEIIVIESFENIVARIANIQQKMMNNILKG